MQERKIRNFPGLEKLKFGCHVYRRKEYGLQKGKERTWHLLCKDAGFHCRRDSAKNAGKEKAGIQKIFSALQRRGGTVRKNMAYLVTHWIYRLSLFTPWDDEELWAVDMAKEAFSCPMTLPTCRRKRIFRIRKIKGEPEKQLEIILGQLTDSEKRSVYESFLVRTCNYG